MFVKKITVLFFILFLFKCGFGQDKFYYSENDYLNYEKIGNGSTNVILLHGYGASIKSWIPLTDELGTSELTLFVFDLKGFGLSSKPRDNKYSVIDQGEILKKFINFNNLNNIILIGHSFGGGVSLYLNAELIKKDQSIIKKIILIDCASYKCDFPLFIKSQRIPILNRFAIFIPKKLGTKVFLRTVFYDIDKIDNDIVERYMFSLNQKGMRYPFIKTARQMIPENYEELINNYKNINNPVLIIWGKNDRQISCKIGEKLNSILLDSRLEIIDKCGHIPFEEYPEIVINLIREFINN
ncbi:alpha/beta fold hydrolase [Bacteroidota bacterium]